jgi:peptidoglycan/LPS O-acetylase OafA/YrhL
VGRFHGLDACRAAAMMLGLFFHGAISFISMPIGWAIRDRSAHPLVDVFVWVCHTFRMPVFFLLAGFFGRLLYEKLGPGPFVRHRAKRLLVPFIVTLIPLMPTLYFLWQWGLARQPVRGPVAMLERASIDPASPKPNPGHLWFLYYLMMILVIQVGLVSVLRKLPLAGIKKAVDAVVGAAVRFRLVVFLMAIPTAATLWSMISLSADTPVDFVPQPRILAYYFVFVAFGWILHRQTDLVPEFGRRLWLPLVIAVVSLLLLKPLVEQAVTKGPPESMGLRFAGLYLGALFGWCLVVLFLGAFVKWGDRPRAWVSYLSDASYWCYLVHLPVTVTLQILMAELPWPGLLKYAIIMTGTIAACLGSYHAIVRYTVLGAALNGPRERPGQSLKAATPSV